MNTLVMIGRTTIKYQFVVLLICIGGQVNASEQCEDMDITNGVGAETLKKYMQEQNDRIMVSISTTVINGQSNSKPMLDTTTTTDSIPITSTMIGNDDVTRSKSETTVTHETSTTTTADDQTATNAVSNQPTLETTTHAQPTTTVIETELRNSEPHACRSSHFEFPTKNHMDYVQYNGSVPQLKAFTACVWLRPEEINEADSYVVMSYCTKVSTHCETILVSLSAIRITVIIEKESGQFNFASAIKVSQWTHACIVISESESQCYINGSYHSKSVKTVSEDIPNGGVLILGNAQSIQINGNSPGGPTDGSNGFDGEMKEFQLWNKELTGNEIEYLFKSGGCSCNTDSIVNFNESNSVTKGNVIALWNNPCP